MKAGDRHHRNLQGDHLLVSANIIVFAEGKLA